MAGVLAIGFFDGVHLGHRRILDGADSVLTFRSHPLNVLLPGSAPAMIMSFGERVASIRECGVRYVIALDFTRELADVTAEGFIPRLRAFNADRIRCGANWRFGRGGEGDAELLRARGFEVDVVPYVEYKGEPVSSTRVREAIGAGDIEGANAMLGRAWRVSGIVERGKGVGAGLGYPTVNLRLPDYLPRFPFGVYEVEALGERAIANWGVAPTMAERAWPSPVMELHFREAPPGLGVALDSGAFDISILRFVRHERTFGSLDELKTQISRDCAAVFGQ